MKKIIRFAVNNPVTMAMVVLVIVLLGNISYNRLNVDLLPDMNAPRLFVEIKADEPEVLPIISSNMLTPQRDACVDIQQKLLDLNQL